jgi:mannose-1-phosphate guanylyltransferase
MDEVKQAFILGAGLGTRLRPLTNHLPKPLVPLFHQPLAAWAIDACVRAGITRIAINTHHLPNAWEGFVQEHGHGTEIRLFHEPVLLETGGGLKNIAAWIDGEPLLIHNGDVFSSLPLERLLAAHRTSGLPVTLAVRSANAADPRLADARHIALDSTHTVVTDIRRMLDRANGTHVFTGIWCANPEFLDAIPADVKVSVIPAFLELAQQGRLGAAVIDDGIWLDLGDRASYLAAHQSTNLGPAIHPDAHVEVGARVETSVVGPGTVIRSGAVVKDSVVWPGAVIAPDAKLHECIVCSRNREIRGAHSGADL